MAKTGRQGVRATRPGTMETWKPVGPPRSRPSDYAQQVIDGGDYRYSQLEARRAFLAGNRAQRDAIAKTWREVASRLEPARYARSIALAARALELGFITDIPAGGLSQYEVELRRLR
jgi:hypothetical protein